MKPIKLEFPLQTPSGEVKTITLRRGKARDMLAAQQQEKDPARRELVLIAMLSAEKLTVEDLEELDLADLAEVQAAFQQIFLPAVRPGAAVAGAGPVGEVVRVPAVRDSGAGPG